MDQRPTGLWPFTEIVLDEIELAGFKVQNIEAHDISDDEGSDFIWGELTPKLALSDGSYMKVSKDFGKYSSDFGTRESYGGDATFDGIHFVEPTKENAKIMAAEFVEYFSNK